MLVKELNELGRHLHAQPVNYKYYDASTAEIVLNEGGLQFSHASVFNDPFDCNVALFEFGEEEVERYAKDLIKREKGSNYQERFRLYKNFQSRLKSNTTQFMEQCFINENADRGVTCFSKCCDKMLMWAHYGANHKGICIGYNLLALRDHIAAINPESCVIPVNYKDEITKIKDFRGIDSVMAWFGTKHSVWSYEQEIRLIARPLAFKNKRFYYKLPNSIISEVIFGASVDPVLRERLINVLKIHFPHVRMYDITPDYNKFQLSKKEIVF